MKVSGYEVSHVGTMDITQPVEACDRIPNRSTDQAVTTVDGYFIIYSWLVTPTVTKWSIGNLTDTSTQNPPNADITTTINMDMDACHDFIKGGTLIRIH